jgi:hypothetical protein
VNTVYTTLNGTIVGVEPGTKSPHDFRVKYRETGKRERTPKHMHVVIDLLMKSVGNEKLTRQLLDHILVGIIDKVIPASSYPPRLQVFQSSQASRFAGLNAYGEYPVDFLLSVIELIQIQEKSNYPNGTLNRTLFALIRDGADLFSIVSAATFRGAA